MRDSDATYLLTEETLAEKSLAVAMELNFKVFALIQFQISSANFNQ